MYRDLLDRFRADSVSWSMWPRLAISVPVVAIGAVFTRSLVISGYEREPQAALLLFIVGIYFFYAVPLLRVLWISSASWKHEQMRARAESQHLDTRLRRYGGTDPATRIETFGGEHSGDGESSRRP